MRRFCLMLDLKDDEALIAEYKRYHADVWPEVKASLVDAGIEEMEIFFAGTRLVMIIDVNDSFSFARKAAMDAANPKVQEWEALMANFQAVPPGADPVRRWAVMEKVFDLQDQ